MSVSLRLRAAFALLLFAQPAGAAPAERCIAAADAAQQHRDDKQLLRARQELAFCSSTACPALVRQDCVRWLDEVDRAMPSIVFIVRGDDEQDLHDVTVSMDGNRLAERLDGGAISVDPGDHTFAFVSGTRNAEQRIFVQTGERSRPVVVRLPGGPPKPLSPTAPEREHAEKHSAPVAPILVAGAGVVVLGAGLLLGALAKSDLGDLESAPCAATKQCQTSDVDGIRKRYVVADVTMGVGVVALAVAGVLWLTGRR